MLLVWDSSQAFFRLSTYNGWLRSAASYITSSFSWKWFTITTKSHCTSIIRSNIYKWNWKCDLPTLCQCPPRIRTRYSNILTVFSISRSMYISATCSLVQPSNRCHRTSNLWFITLFLYLFSLCLFHLSKKLQGCFISNFSNTIVP